jgi:hypothetical protein
MNWMRKTPALAYPDDDLRTAKHYIDLLKVNNTVHANTKTRK